MAAIATDYPDYMRARDDDYATRLAQQEDHLAAVGAALPRLREKRAEAVRRMAAGTSAKAAAEDLATKTGGG